MPRMITVDLLRTLTLSDRLKIVGSVIVHCGVGLLMLVLGF